MNFPHVREALLKARKIGPEGEAEFLSPDFGKLHDPMLLPDIEAARDRVIKAMQEGEHIAVFSDYDADGIPGAVVVSDFFKRSKYENVSFYIPHRHDEGFGLNMGAIDKLAKRGAKLLITIDCGTADLKEVAHARKLGMDVIITDHHEPGGKLPDALVVNPKRKDSAYPFKELCGSAVVFKLIQAILAKEKFGSKEGMEKWSMDMVGIATLSDMVPLRGENRILAKFGLDVLRKSPRPGLRALCKKLKVEQQYMTEDDIGFMITPRINAASRMGVPMDAFDLLTATEQSEAARLADHLESINKERKTTVGVLVKEAKALLAKRELREVIVISNPEWRPALCGLVANSLVEEYARPVFVWGRDGDGVLKGSCRSYNGYDLFALMSTAADCFIEFGGHAGAGGFSITLENIGTLEEKLSEALQKGDKSLLEGQPEEGEHIIIEIQEVCEDLWRVVSEFAPFGNENEKPIFKIPVEIRSARQFGKAQEHLEVILACLRRDVKAIAFFSSPENYSASLTAGSRVSLLAHLEKSYFMNRPELRLRIVDII